MSYIAALRSCPLTYRLGLLVSIFASIAAALPSAALDYQYLSRKSDLLTVQEAREYMVELVNRDRATQGLSPVALDGTASVVAQAHTDEMAQWSYLSHWDLKGRKPDERYSDAGGRGAVFENVYTNHRNPYFGRNAALSSNRLIPRREVEQAEQWLFNQQAPYDRHRRNILDPHHGTIGVGLSTAYDQKWGLRVSVAQEFVHTGAEMAHSPSQIAPGEKKRISGRVKSGASLAAIQIYREGLPLPMTPSELNCTGPYGLPSCAVANYPPPMAGYQSPVTVSKFNSNEEFSLDLAADRNWAHGLYYILVWVKDPGHQQPYVGSLRTVRVMPDTGDTSTIAQAPASVNVPVSAKSWVSPLSRMMTHQPVSAQPATWVSPLAREMTHKPVSASSVAYVQSVAPAYAPATARPTPPVAPIARLIPQMALYARISYPVPAIVQAPKSPQPPVIAQAPPVAQTLPIPRTPVVQTAPVLLHGRATYIPSDVVASTTQDMTIVASPVTPVKTRASSKRTQLDLPRDDRLSPGLCDFRMGVL